MEPDYLHNHNDFADLINIVGKEMSISPTLVEKDYWIMHCLYGLQKLNLAFEVKGGTSLSKGHNLIKRFSEDIDIRIDPPAHMSVKTGRNHDKPAHIQSRQKFYDWLAQTIKIDGIVQTERDAAFDDAKYRSGGIQLRYFSTADGILEGVLLEIGFDNVTPNNPIDISSWAYDFAVDKKVEIIDNRALAVACYHPGYTLVEKLQAISTKYRQQQSQGLSPTDFMRHYYDVYCLLHSPIVQNFIGTEEYVAHKKKRFRSHDNLVIAENEAFLLSLPEIYQTYEQAYQETSALYYESQPEFKNIMELFQKYFDKL
jgi:Nucleotidyl transferase AbiEii toxin, Type IV TA system